jgi:hypothetical protein
LSDDLAHEQNPAGVVGARVASSASVRTEKRGVDRRILVRASSVYARKRFPSTKAQSTSRPKPGLSLRCR